jgi:hypothetical protein
MCNSRSETAVDPTALLRSGMPTPRRMRAKEVSTDFARRSLGLFNPPSGSQLRHPWFEETSAPCQLDLTHFDAKNLWSRAASFLPRTEKRGTSRPY